MANYVAIFGHGYNYVAVFETLYRITIVYDSSLGSASYTRNVIDGNIVTLSATPNADAQFVGWYNNSLKLSGDLTYALSLAHDTVIEARFEPIYQVTTSVSGDGAISFTRGADQNDVTFNVIPDANHHFVKYDVNGVEYFGTPLTLHLTEDVNVVAYFEEDEKAHISASANIKNGSIYISKNDDYPTYTSVLWARPFPDYVFDHWEDGSYENPRTITVTENVAMVAIYQRLMDTNGIYQYRCFIKDQLDLEATPKSFMVVDTFTVKPDLMTNSTSTINVQELSSNVNIGDVLVLYDPMGTPLYNGVIKAIDDLKITCSQMQSFYKGLWIYNVYPSATLEEEVAYLLDQYAQGKIYGSTYTDDLVAQRLGGITIDYEGSTSANLPTDLDENGDEKYTTKDMEQFIYDLYENYGIIFDFEINVSGTNYVHIKVADYQPIKVGNNMFAIQDMLPMTTVEETNRLIVFAQDKTYRKTYVATKNGIVEEPSTTANRFDVTNTKIVFSDDDLADLVSANLPDVMYNHKIEFSLIIKNFIYEFGDFNLGGSLDIYYGDDYYSSVLTGYEITKASNQNITRVRFVCGKVRTKLTQRLTLGNI